MATEGVYPGFWFSPLQLLCPEGLRNFFPFLPTLDRNTSAAALPANNVITLHTLSVGKWDDPNLIKGPRSVFSTL